MYTSFLLTSKLRLLVQILQISLLVPGFSHLPDALLPGVQVFLGCKLHLEPIHLCDVFYVQHQLTAIAHPTRCCQVSDRMDFRPSRVLVVSDINRTVNNFYRYKCYPYTLTHRSTEYCCSGPRNAASSQGLRRPSR